MTWFRVDDGFSDHPKVVALRGSRCWKGALALWTLAGSWASKQESDGFVPLRVVRFLGGSEAEAGALVGVSLWEKVDGGYRFHDWSDSNPTSEQLQAKRGKTKERVEKWRDRKSTPDPSNSVTESLQVDHVTPLVTPPPSRPVPSRPVPTHTERVRAPEERPPPESPPGWDPHAFAASVPTRFRKLYLARFQVDVAVGGQQVGGFPDRLRTTAEARGVEPLALLEQLFGAWVDQGRPGVDKQIPPYAAFVARFDALAAPAEHVQSASPEQRLKAMNKRNVELMEANNFGPEWQKLNEEMQALQREIDSRGGEPRRAFAR